MSFFIDNEFINQTVSNPRDAFAYNVSVFARSGLSNGQHKFTLVNGASNGFGDTSLVLFDYLVYT